MEKITTWQLKKIKNSQLVKISSQTTPYCCEVEMFSQALIAIFIVIAWLLKTYTQF